MSGPSRKGNFGHVVGRPGDVVTIEIPADVSVGLNAVWGLGGFSAVVTGPTTKLAPRRVNGMNGTIVCDNDPVTTAVYVISIDLSVDTR